MSIELYKGRTVEDTQLVKVYYNLHKHMFSIKDYETGLILAHGNDIYLNNVEFRVSEAGRQRVLETGVKNVHAYAIGNIDLTYTTALYNPTYIYYNPFTTEKFMNGDKPIEYSIRVFLSDKKVFAQVT